MFPPIDDAVFQNNPKFALLHKELTTTILNPDGSTKNHPAQAEREATSKVRFLPYETNISPLTNANSVSTNYESSKPNPISSEPP